MTAPEFLVTYILHCKIFHLISFQGYNKPHLYIAAQGECRVIEILLL